MNMRSQPREPFFMIPDRLITEGEETHLTEIELYLYSLLLRKKNYEGVTETSITFLHETSPIEFGSSKQRSIDLIKTGLLSLMEKKVIRICNGKREILNNYKLINDDGEITKEYKPSDLIIIIFGNSSIKGHTEIDYSKFDSFETMSDYYIYVATLRWIGSGNGNFNCSYERWARILQVTDKTAKTKVNEAVEKKIVYKNIGNYKDEVLNGRPQKRQNVNAYRTTPFQITEKTIMTKKQEAENVADLF
ncbi:hypothetical protein ACIQYS_01545 [Psychrobacillus sp. NPDC096426]|uniref:hypothetical protein n=1 Tax=Psychrobacillus sp. NPDC096426 TaxID=3364491 RepID=UPI0037F92333